MTTYLPPRAEVSAEPAVWAGRWGWVAVGSLAVAGALHVAAAADHLAAGDVVVGFFLLVAFLQLGTGVWLAVRTMTRSGHSPWPVASALAVTVGLLLLYLAAHTTDLLAGVVDLQHHGEATSAPHGTAHVEAPEPAGPIALGLEPARTSGTPGMLGTVTVGIELVSVLALAALLPAPLRRRGTDALLVIGVLAWGVWFTGVAA
jgi:hypothetical protein